MHKLPSAFGTKLFEHEEQKLGTAQLMQLYMLHGTHIDDVLNSVKLELHVEHTFGYWHKAQLETLQIIQVYA